MFVPLGVQIFAECSEPPRKANLSSDSSEVVPGLDIKTLRGEDVEESPARSKRFANDGRKEGTKNENNVS